MVVPTERPLFSSLGYSGNPTPPPTSYLPVPHPVPYRPAQTGWNGSSQLSGSDAMHAKNRTTFLVLGVLFGALGVHSFYAGYTRKGLIQLAVTVFTMGFGGLMVWIWAVIDICTISTDSDGIAFRN
jgi:TM2 domain-containing membrane protein YozV